MTGYSYVIVPRRISARPMVSFQSSTLIRLLLPLRFFESDSQPQTRPRAGNWHTISAEWKGPFSGIFMKQVDFVRFWCMTSHCSSDGDVIARDVWRKTGDWGLGLWGGNTPRAYPLILPHHAHAGRV